MHLHVLTACLLPLASLFSCSVLAAAVHKSHPSRQSTITADLLLSAPRIIAAHGYKDFAQQCGFSMRQGYLETRSSWGSLPLFGVFANLLMSLNTDGRLEKPSAQHLRVAAVFPPNQLEKTEGEASQLHQFNHFNATTRWCWSVIQKEGLDRHLLSNTVNYLTTVVLKLFDSKVPLSNTTFKDPQLWQSCLFSQLFY